MRPLTYILLFVFVTCVLTMCGDPANAVSFKDHKTIELTETEAKTCGEEGGCVVVTNAFMEKMMAIFELLQRQAKEAKGKSCA